MFSALYTAHILLLLWIVIEIVCFPMSCTRSNGLRLRMFSGFVLDWWLSDSGTKLRSCEMF